MTTINEKLQVAAEDSFRNGLKNYSKGQVGTVQLKV